MTLKGKPKGTTGNQAQELHKGTDVVSQNICSVCDIKMQTSLININYRINLINWMENY